MGDEPTAIGERKLEPAYNDAGALPLNRFNDTFQIFKCDAFSIEGGAANHFGASGGLSPEFIEASIAVVKQYFKLQAGTVVSLDPACDSNGRFLEAGVRCIRQIVSE